MSKTKSMTAGNPYSLILAFALPLMAGNVFQQLYTVFDTMIVGQFLGVTALAALGTTDWFNWMMIGMIQGLTQGFGILMAQAFGAGDHGRLRKVTGNSILLTIISAVILLVLGQLLMRPVLLLLQTPEEVLGIALSYLRIIFAGIPIVMAYNLLACILRSLGDSRTPLIAMVIAALTNIGLDILFVGSFGMGVQGAAIATVLAQLLSALFCLRQILKIEILRLSRSDFSLEARLCGRLLYMGMPMALQNMLISVGGMVVQSVVNSFGVLFIAGFTATNKLYGVLEIAAISYGYAMTTYMGQNLGAGKLDRIRKGMRAMLVIGTATSLIIAACMFGFGRMILSLFISGTPEEVEETLSIAFHFLSVMSAFLPALYLVHIARNAVEGLGNSSMPLMSGLAELVMRLSAALFLTRIMGPTALFWGEVLAWFGADIVLVIAYLVVLGRVRWTLAPASAE